MLVSIFIYWFDFARDFSDFFVVMCLSHACLVGRGVAGASERELEQRRERRFHEVGLACVGMTNYN